MRPGFDNQGRMSALVLCSLVPLHMRLRCVVCLRVPGAPIASAIRCLPGSLFGNAFAAVLDSGKGHGLENAGEVHKQFLPLPGGTLQRARPRRALDLPRALAGQPIPAACLPFEKSATMRAQ